MSGGAAEPAYIGNCSLSASEGVWARKKEILGICDILKLQINLSSPVCKPSTESLILSWRLSGFTLRVACGGVLSSHPPQMWTKAVSPPRWTDLWPAPRARPGE